MSSHEQMSGMARMMDQMHPKTFIQEVRHHATSGTSAAPKLRPRSNADVHEGELDADVPWKRVRSGHAAVELADYSHPAFATADIELLVDRRLACPFVAQGAS
jgi:hypothetical protein